MDRFKFRLAVKQGIEWQIYDVLNILFKEDGSVWVQARRQTEVATFPLGFWLMEKTPYLSNAPD